MNITFAIEEETDLPQVLKDEVEQRIRRAALEVFAEKGYPAAAMAEIARRAGISAGNIYRYFPGKKALFAVVAHIDRVGLLFKRAANETGDFLFVLYEQDAHQVSL